MGNTCTIYRSHLQNLQPPEGSDGEPYCGRSFPYLTSIDPQFFGTSIASLGTSETMLVALFAQ